MMPLSSTPTVVNTVVFPLNGVQGQTKIPHVLVVSQAVNRASTY